MMDDMKKLMGKRADVKMSPEEIQAKMEVVQELLMMAQDAMKGSVKSGMDEMLGPKTVSVSAPDDESLAEGLSMAEGMVDEDAEGDDESSDESATESAMSVAEGVDKDEDEENEGMPKRKSTFSDLL